MTYSDKLKSPKWQKKRLEILKRDKFKCKMCGDADSQLQVHHKKYTGGDPWESDNLNLISLCTHCHNVFHTYLSNESITPFDKIKILKMRRSDRVSEVSMIISATEKGLSFYGLNPDDTFQFAFTFSDISIGELENMIKIQKKLRLK